MPRLVIIWRQPRFPMASCFSCCLSQHLNRCSHLFKWWLDELDEMASALALISEVFSCIWRSPTKSEVVFFHTFFCLFSRFLVDYQLGFCPGHLAVAVAWPITCLISRWPNSPLAPECALCCGLLFILMQARKNVYNLVAPFYFVYTFI